jgi:hypothetical protein
MIKTGRGLTTFVTVLGVVVAGGIVYGLLGEQIGIRAVNHSPETVSGSLGK